MSLFRDSIIDTLQTLNLVLEDHHEYLTHQLREARVANNNIEVISNELRNSAAHLQKLLKAYERATDADDPALEAALRRFLSVRWDYIRNTPTAYVEFPESPMNGLCQHIAIALAKPGESIAKILMPTLTVDYYMAIDETLISITETDPENGDRSLALHQFIVSRDGRSVIPLHAWFSRVDVKTDGPNKNHVTMLGQDNATQALEPEAFYVKAGLVEPQRGTNGYHQAIGAYSRAYREYTDTFHDVAMSPQDLELMTTSVGDASQAYFREVTRQADFKNRFPLTTRLNQLCDELEDNGEKKGKSDKNATANKFQAHPDGEVKILEFLTFWNKLPQAQKDAVKQLPDTVYPRWTFESYILMFRLITNDTTLTQRELDRIEDDSIVWCADTIADYIRKIIKANPIAFTGAPANAPSLATLRQTVLDNLAAKKAATFNPTRFPRGFTDLEERKNTFIAALNKPKSIKNFNELLACLDTTSRNDLDALLQRASAEDILVNLMQTALEQQSPRAADVLLPYFTKQHKLSPETLRTALSKGWPEGTIASLLNAISDINESVNDNGDTILHVAIEKDWNSVIDTCLMHKYVKLNIQNRQGQTPLHTAIRLGKTNLVYQLLNEKGIQKNFQDSEGRTPLDLAFAQVDIELIRQMINKGANFSNHFGKRNPLLNKIINGSDLLIALLDLEINSPHIPHIQGLSNPDLATLFTEMKNSRKALLTILGTYSNYQGDNNGSHLKAAIKRFLSTRWYVIRNTTAAYVEFPNSPMNLVCQDLALMIAQPNESIAKILMPTLTVESYTHFGENLIELTERSPTDRRLATERFIISHNGQDVIHLGHWFRFQATFGADLPWLNHGYQLDRNNEILLDLESYLEKDEDRDDTAYYAYAKAREPLCNVPLDPQDLQNLRSAAPPHSGIFFDEVHNRQNHINTVGTLGSTMAALIPACTNHSTHAGSIMRTVEANGEVLEASSGQAHSGAGPFIHAFLNKWKALPAATQQSLGKLTDPDGGKTFYRYVLDCRWAVGDKMTAAEKLEQGGTEDCIWYLGKGLQRILNRHAGAINGAQSDPIPLDKLRGTICNALQTQRPTLNTARFTAGYADLRVKHNNYRENLACINRTNAFTSLEDLLQRMDFIPSQDLEALLRNMPPAMLQTLMQQALDQDSDPALNALMPLFADPQVPVPNNVMQKAVGKACVPFIVLLINRGIDFSGRFGQNNRSLLYLSIENNWAAVLGYYPANIVAVYSAVLRGTLTAQDLAAQQNEIPLNFFGDSLFAWAVARNDANTLQIMVEHGLNFTGRFGPENKSLLHWAVMNNHYGLVELLIKKGADLSETYAHQSNQAGVPLLHILAERPSANTLWVLLDRLAFEDDFDINCHSGNGLTALHLAVNAGQALTVVMLLNNADIAGSFNQKALGETPLELAIRQNQPRIIEAFIASKVFSEAAQDMNPALERKLFECICLSNDAALIQNAKRNGLFKYLAFNAYDLGPNEKCPDGIFNGLRQHQVNIAPRDLMSNPALDKIIAYHGFDNLSLLAGLQAGSKESLDLYAQAEICRINRDPEAKGERSNTKKTLLSEGIKASDPVQGRVTILYALEMHRSHRSNFVSTFSGTKPSSYNNLPVVFKHT